MCMAKNKNAKKFIARRYHFYKNIYFAMFWIIMIFQMRIQKVSLLEKYVDDSTFLTAPVGGKKKKIGENMILPCARRDNSWFVKWKYKRNNCFEEKECSLQNWKSSGCFWDFLSSIKHISAGKKSLTDNCGFADASQYMFGQHTATSFFLDIAIHLKTNN